MPEPNSDATAPVPQTTSRPSVRGRILPLVAAIVVLCAMALLVVPMLKATPKDIPVGFLSLDAGATTPGGPVNLGTTMQEKLTTADTPLSWTVFSSQADLQAALDDNQLYAALVVPADFTASQMAAKVDPTKTASPLGVTLDQGKNPTVAAALQPMFAGMAAQAGVTVKVTTINPVPADMGSGTIVLVIALVTILASLITGIVLAINVGIDRLSQANRGRLIIGQVVYGVVLAGIIGVGAATIGRMAGITLPFGSVALMAGAASLAMILIATACIDWLGLPGVVIPALVMLLGMPTLILPGEFLPSFWRNLIYPWAPQRFTGDGLRAVLFLGKGGWNADTTALALIAGVALIVMLATLALKRLPGARRATAS